MKTSIIKTTFAAIAATLAMLMLAAWTNAPAGAATQEPVEITSVDEIADGYDAASAGTAYVIAIPGLT